jgi:formate hydrogenlyase subunit 3/multisubunit Na+/H+ antiporter MnhD subunit
LQTAKFIALIVAAIAPICAASAVWRHGGRVQGLVAGLQLITGIAAAVAMVLQPSGETWFVLTQALVVGSVCWFVPGSAIVPRVAFAVLLLGQSGATVLVLADDLRWIAGSAVICGLVPVVALAVVARSLSNSSVRESVAETSRRMLVLASIGSCLIVLGLIVAVFADAAIRARATHVTSGFRFDWSLIRPALETASSPGGRGSEIWKQLAPWSGVPMIVGFSLLTGCLPFHRPVATALRQVPPAMRVMFYLSATAAMWAGVVRFLVPLMATSIADLGWLLRPLAVLMLWLGALLVLSRGDLPRLIAAAVLYASGLLAVPLALTGGAAHDATRLLLAGQIPLLCAVIVLLGWVQMSFDSIDFSEFGGLANLLPRFSTALTVCVLGLCGAPLLSVFPGLWTAWISIASVQAAGADGVLDVSLWQMLIPQLIAVWGWVRILDGLLRGAPRTPAMPSVLIDRVEIIPASTTPPRDLSARELAAIAVLIAWGLAIGLRPGIINGEAPSAGAIDTNRTPMEIVPIPTTP